MTIKHWFLVTFVGIISAASAVTFYRLTDDATIDSTAQTTTEYEPASLVKILPSADQRPGVGVTDFTIAAARTTPTVVHVKTVYAARSQGRTMDFFRDFFGQEMDPRAYEQAPVQRSSGSGVIISNDGYIVTNNHVIEKAEQIEVVLHDRKKLKAVLVGADPATDLALLKVGNLDDELPSVAFGNSDSVRVGEWVMAVGNPFELESTVTAGIVSAKGRDINILQHKAGQPAVESFIQTDAAVNPGNSGGALVNTEGELIGINTAIATPTGTYAGYSFAVPVNIVRKVIADLMDFGIVQRAYLGVMIDITQDDLGGVFISDIIEGTASADSELRKGDVITRINEFPVTTFPELQEQVSKYRPGDRVKIDFDREGRSRSTFLTLRNADKNTALVEREQSKPAEVLLGARMIPLSEDQLQEFDIRGGVEVEDVGRGEIATMTRIREGFVITSVNDEPVEDISDINNALAQGSGTAMIEGFYPESPYKIYNYGLMLNR